MSRSFDRGLKRAAELIRPKRQPEPDFTGWTPVEVMTWKVKNGASFEAMVRAARVAREEKRDGGTADRERERLAAEPEAAAAATKPAPAEKPKRKRKRRQPGQPTPEPKPWWEEKARWRPRGPADYDWEDAKPNGCIYEYDPLTWDDRD